MRYFRLTIQQILFITLAVFLLAPQNADGHSKARKIWRAAQSSKAKNGNHTVEQCTIPFALERLKNARALVFCSFTGDDIGKNTRQLFSSNGSSWRSVPTMKGKGEWQFVGRSKDGKN